MDSKLKLDQQTLESTRQKLLQALQLPISIADRGINKVRTLSLISLLSAVWLSFYLIQLFDLSLLSTLPLLLIFGLPTLILAKFYFVLQEVICLPERINSFFGTVKGKAVEFQQKAKVEIQTKLQERKPKFSDLLSFGKVLRDVISLASELQEISSLMGGALILSNPLFIALVGISTAITFLCALVAAITVLVYLF